MKTKTAVIITTALGTFALSSFAVKARQKAGDYEDDLFDWISADQGEPEPSPKPMFYVGDKVLLYSPYTAEFYTEEWKVAPEQYEITDVKYDDEEGVFRYRLKNGLPSHWYSEDWLSLPDATTFVREWVPVKPGEVTIEMADAERKLLSKALDDFAENMEVDRLLDVMNEGTAEEKAEAEQRLKELSRR